MIQNISATSSTLSTIQKTATVEQFIDMINSNPIDYQKLSYVDKIGNINFPSRNVISDYLPELKAVATKIKLSDNEMIKYKYRPKLLAGDVYNNQELYYIILLLNGMADVREFDKKEILMIAPSQMSDCLSYIYNAEKKSIDTYNNQ